MLSGLRRRWKNGVQMKVNYELKIDTLKKNISSKIIQALKLLLGCDRAFVFCGTESTTDYLKKVAGFHGIQAASKYILLNKLVRPVLDLLK